MQIHTGACRPTWFATEGRDNMNKDILRRLLPWVLPVVVGCVRSTLPATEPGADAEAGPPDAGSEAAPSDAATDTEVPGNDASGIPGCPFSWVNPLPQGNALHAAWASGPLGSGGGIVVRGDAASWTEVESTPYALHAIWGDADADVWAVGDSGAIVRFDGATWSSAPSPTSDPLYAIWGTGSSDVWV